MTDKLTEQEAIAFYHSGRWRQMDHTERARFQIKYERLCMPFEVFHEAVEQTLQRPVYTHEFGIGWKGLEKELLDGAPPPTNADILRQLTDMMKPEAQLVVVAPAEKQGER